MCRHQSWWIGTFHNPCGENARVQAVWRLHLAFHREFLPKPGFCLLGHSLRHAMLAQGGCHRFPMLTAKATIEKEFRLRPSILVVKVQQIIHDLRSLHQQHLAIGKLC